MAVQINCRVAKPNWNHESLPIKGGIHAHSDLAKSSRGHRYNIALRDSCNNKSCVTGTGRLLGSMCVLAVLFTDRSSPITGKSSGFSADTVTIETIFRDKPEPSPPALPMKFDRYRCQK